MEEYVTTKEAAEVLSARFGAFSIDTIRNLCRQGKVKGAVRESGEWKVPLSWTNEYKKASRLYVGKPSLTLQEAAELLNR